MQVDLLHPLATLNWEESSGLGPSLNAPIGYGGGSVVLNNKVYCVTSKSLNPQLFMFSIQWHSWTVLKTPASNYTLTTYLSQLVLVGGMEANTTETTNKLWTSAAGLNWKQSLPPMPTKRSFPTAVNTELPECIVVAGGCGDDHNEVDIVEIYIQDQWATVQPLPKKCSLIMSTVHNGKIYLMGGFGQDKDVYYCEIESLLKIQLQNLWGQFEVPYENYSYPVSFRQELLINHRHNDKILAYSFLTQHCVHVGNAPVHLNESFVLPTGELMVFAGEGKIFKGSIKGDSSYRDAFEAFSSSLAIMPLID